MKELNASERNHAGLDEYSKACQISKMELSAKIVNLLYRESLQKNLTFEYKGARKDFKYQVHGVSCSCK